MILLLGSKPLRSGSSYHGAGSGRPQSCQQRLQTGRLGPQLLWARCHRSRRPRPQLRHRALGRRVHLSVPILGVACPGAASQIPLPPVSCRGRRRLPLSSRPPPHHQAAPPAAGGEASPGQAPKDAPPNHSLRSCRSVSPPLSDTRRLASLRPPGPSAQRHRPHGSVDPPTLQVECPRDQCTPAPLPSKDLRTLLPQGPPRPPSPPFPRRSPEATGPRSWDDLPLMGHRVLLPGATGQMARWTP